MHVTFICLYLVYCSFLPLPRVYNKASATATKRYRQCLKKNTEYSLILKRMNALRLFVQTGHTRPLKPHYIKINGYLLILRVVMRFSDS
mgnify:CR=1 FL=1